MVSDPVSQNHRTFKAHSPHNTKDTATTEATEPPVSSTVTIVSRIELAW